jgi:LmbE family N-acetylglucosaminyl deacetylase
MAGLAGLTPRCLVAVHAHPDDEAITTGGILARFAAEGVRTVVVTCTGGDAGPNRGPETARLADLRGTELAEALRVLGAARGVQLGFPDSGFPSLHKPGTFSEMDVRETAEAIAAVLRQEQPDTVVTYDADGGYGHADHVHAHAATMLACRTAAPAAEVYAVVFPRTLLDRWVELMPGAGRAALLGIEDLDTGADFGTQDELVTDVVEVSAYVDVKRRALAAHWSQMGDDHPLVRMPDIVRREVWAREYFRRLI